MSKVSIVDCASATTTTRDATPAEQAVIDADHDAGAAKVPVQAAATARQQDADTALSQIIALAGGQPAVRQKLRAVLAGTDTFTAPQVQRLVAALVLAVLRDRTDS